MSFTRKLITAALLCAAVAAFAASSLAATSTGATVKVGSTGLGRVLVTTQGKTLYLWAGDHGRTSNCYGDCAEYWPPLLTTGKPTAVGGANAKLLGTTKRSDGRLQVTYKGHPLYTFVQDAKRGQTKGEGLTGFGGRWDPVSASGAAVRTPPSATSASASSDSAYS
jgi:predicted lipoprotein with Yx(FWY)xxD motif